MKYFYLIFLLFLHLFVTEIESLSILSTSTKPKKSPVSLLGSSSSKKPATGGLLSSLSNLLSITPPKPDVDDAKSSTSTSSDGGSVSTVKNSIAPAVQSALIDKPILPSVLQSIDKSEPNIQHAVSSTPELASTGSLVTDQETKSPSAAEVLSTLPPVSKSEDAAFMPPLSTIAPSVADVNLETKSPSVSQGVETPEYHLKDVKDEDTVSLKPGKDSIVVEMPRLENIVPFASVAEPTVLHDVGQQNIVLQDKVETLNKPYLDLQDVQLSVGTEQKIGQQQDAELSQGVKLQGAQLHDGQIQGLQLQNVEPPNIDLHNVRVENVGMKHDAVDVDGQTLPSINLLPNVASKVPDTLDLDFIDPTNTDPSESEVLVNSAEDIAVSAADVQPMISSVLDFGSHVPEQVNIVQSGAEPITIPTDTRAITSLVPNVEILDTLESTMQPGSSIEPDLGTIAPFVTDPEVIIRAEILPISDVAFTDASLPNDGHIFSIAPVVEATPIPDIDFSTPLSEILSASESPVILPDSLNLSSPIDSMELPGITNLVSTMSGGLIGVFLNLTNALRSTPGLNDLVVYSLSILHVILTSISRLTGVPQAENIISSIPAINPLLDGLLLKPEMFIGVLRNAVSSSRESLFLLSRLQLSGPEGLTALLNLALNFLNDILAAIPRLRGNPLDIILSELQVYIGTFKRILPNLRIDS